MSKRSVRKARTSSLSSQSQPSPKRNRFRLSSDEMEAGEECESGSQTILDKLSILEERMEEHFGSLRSEISRLSAEVKQEVEGINDTLKEVEKPLQCA